MTVLVGLARNGRVTIGADTANTIANSHVYGTRKAGKLRANGALRDQSLVAVTGNGALLPLAMSLDTTDYVGGDADFGQYVAEKLTAAAFRAEPRLIIQYPDKGEQIDGNVMLGYRGRLWTLLTNQAHEHTDGIATLGVGRELALGYLTGALHHRPQAWSDTDVVDAAVRFTCHHEPWCGIDESGPYVLELGAA